MCPKLIYFWNVQKNTSSVLIKGVDWDLINGTDTRYGSLFIIWLIASTSWDTKSYLLPLSLASSMNKLAIFYACNIASLEWSTWSSFDCSMLNWILSILYETPNHGYTTPSMAATISSLDESNFLSWKEAIGRKI